MCRPKINRVSSRVLLLLTLTALLTVASGYLQPHQPPEPDEGTAAHIFQLSVVAVAPILLLFLATADWQKPLAALRPLIIPCALLVLSFAAVYYLEHHF